MLKTGISKSNHSGFVFAEISWKCKEMHAWGFGSAICGGFFSQRLRGGRRIEEFFVGNPTTYRQWPQATVMRRCTSGVAKSDACV